MYLEVPTQIYLAPRQEYEENFVIILKKTKDVIQEITEINHYHLEIIFNVLVFLIITGR